LKNRNKKVLQNYRDVQTMEINKITGKGLSFWANLCYSRASRR